MEKSLHIERPLPRSLSFPHVEEQIMPQPRAVFTACAVWDIPGYLGCERLYLEASMFKLISTVRRGSSTGIPAAFAHYPTMAAARLGTVALLRDDRVLRVMIVRNEIPPAFVEWVER
jgi:hypothetical protein